MCSLKINFRNKLLRIVTTQTGPNSSMIRSVIYATMMQWKSQVCFKSTISAHLELSEKLDSSSLAECVSTCVQVTPLPGSYLLSSCTVRNKGKWYGSKIILQISFPEYQYVQLYQSRNDYHTYFNTFKYTLDSILFLPPPLSNTEK